MRQLVHFLELIRIRITTKEYYYFLFFAKLNHAEIPPLEDILGVSSNEDESAFDEKTDKILEEHAKNLLREKQWQKNLSK